MRIATFNVENMFERPAAMNLPSQAATRKVLEDFEALNVLIGESTYTPAVKAKILAIVARQAGLAANGVSTFIRLREMRGKLLRIVAGQPELAVGGRNDWVGWFELVEEQVNAVALMNTARIVGLLKADALTVVEADDRLALDRFNRTVLPQVGATPFDHVMLVDGNDERGIDIGLLTRATCPIRSIVSHVDDRDAEGRVFSRDCAEYHLELPSGETLVLLCNHFKSKGFGSQATSNAKRRRQAVRTRQIYDARRAAGAQLVAVLGDLNDTPASAPLEPLLQNGADLVDVMVHPRFTGDGRPGTHGNGTASAKLDYLLMSPALATRVTACGIERRGVWGGVNGTLFPHLPEITKKIEAASDHAALFVDFT